MLKDVRKSLILWPLTAAVLVMLLSWLSTNVVVHPFADSASDCVSDSIFSQPIVDVVHHGVLPQQPSTFDLERSEHGVRAIPIPQRLGHASSSAQNKTRENAVLAIPLAAPVRNEAHELAGLRLAPPLRLPRLVTAQTVSTSTASRSAAPNGNETGETILPSSVTVLAKRLSADPIVPARPVDLATIELVPAEPTTTETTTYDVDTEESPTGWPITSRLDHELSQLAEYVTEGGSDDFASTSETTYLLGWVSEVQNRLAQLRGLARLGDDDAGRLINELHELFTVGHAAAETLRNRLTQIRWLYACYALERRVAVWKPIWELSSSNDTARTWVRPDTPAKSSLDESIAGVRKLLPQTEDVAGWNTYLLLDELERCGRGSTAGDSVTLAQRFLSRLRWHGLHPEHRLWLDNSAIDTLAAAVRPWACSAVDYPSLLCQIEHQEANEIDTISVEIAEAVQTLRHAENPRAVEVASALDTYYRNANIRIALSERLLQRVLPSIEEKTVPVRTEILGSQVRGESRVESQLQVRLDPSLHSWKFELQTLGNVRTRAVGLNGPVSVLTAGNSKFIASTPIEISSLGFRKGTSSVEADGTNRLRSIETDYDQWPLIGTLVRTIAESRYEQLKPESSRLSNEQLRQSVGGQVDQEVETKLNQSSDQLSQMLLGPLGALRLDPQVVDMQTTDQRLLARYRLAGDWQLGAFSPRPRALRDSLMSVQVHQSAMNNMLEQLVPRDHPRPIREMVTQAAYLFGRDGTRLPNDIPADVMIQFAPTRPITIEIEDDKMWLTLRIVRLTRGEHMDLRRFIVRSAYVASVDGLSASLVRDGHLRISGPSLSMRERLPIRAIFNKVLSTTHGFPITNGTLQSHAAAKNLAISQMELRAGWLAISVSEAEHARVAVSETNTQR